MSEKESGMAVSSGKPKIIKEGYQPNDGVVPINPPKVRTAVQTVQPTRPSSNNGK